MIRLIAQIWFVAMVCCCGTLAHASQVAKLSYRWHEVQQPAPNVLLSLGKARTSLKAYEGKTVMVHFWASWCGPCMAELPTLDALAKKYPDIVLLTVATDNAPYDDLYDILFKQLKLRHVQMVHDDTGALLEAMGKGGLPITYIMNKKNMLTHYYMGATDWTLPEHAKVIEGVLKR